MPAPIDMIEGSRVAGHRPWPRVVVNENGWRFVTGQMSAGHWTLLGLWGDTGAAHMAVLDERAGEIVVATFECQQGTFPSVGALHPPAIRLERAIRDLYGFDPVGLTDTRPWLDLGFWGVRHPLGARSETPAARAPYDFLPAEGENLHQIPVGPVHAGIIEPGHFRFTANGETVVRLEQRLGYVHKGIEVADGGRDARQGGAARRPHVGRQHGRLFARVRACRRGGAGHQGSAARGLFACADGRAGAPRQSLRRYRRDLQRRVLFPHARAMRHPARAHLARGRCLLRPSADDGPHRARRRRRRSRRRRNCAVAGASRERSGSRFPELVELYDNTASLQDRTVTTGVLRPELARQFGAGGYVGRAVGPRVRCAQGGRPIRPTRS